MQPILPLYATALNTAQPSPGSARNPCRYPGGLILTKLVAFRPQDQADIELLLLANRDTIDLDLVRTEWAALAGKRLTRPHGTRPPSPGLFRSRHPRDRAGLIS